MPSHPILSLQPRWLPVWAGSNPRVHFAPEEGNCPADEGEPVLWVKKLGPGDVTALSRGHRAHQWQRQGWALVVCLQPSCWPLCCQGTEKPPSPKPAKREMVRVSYSWWEEPAKAAEKDGIWLRPPAGTKQSLCPECALGGSRFTLL